MSQYFIQRGEKTHGPFSAEQITAGVQAGKIKAGDSIAKTKDGPWEPIVENCQSCGGVLEHPETMMSGLCDVCSADPAPFDSLDIPDSSSAPSFNPYSAGQKRDQGGVGGDSLAEDSDKYTLRDFLVPQRLFGTPLSSFEAKGYPGLTFAMQLYLLAGKIFYALAFIPTGFVIIFGTPAAFMWGWSEVNLLAGATYAGIVLLLGLLQLLLLNIGLALMIASAEMIKVITQIERNTR